MAKNSTVFLAVVCFLLVGKVDAQQNVVAVQREQDVIDNSIVQRRVNDAGLNDMIMASMSFGQKLDFLAALSLKKFLGNTRQQNHIHLIVKALSEAEEFRNRMLHSIWTENFVDYSQVKAKTKGRKGLRVERANANISHIRQAVKAINTLENLGLFVMTHDAIVDQTDEKLFHMSKVFQKS